MFFRCVFGRIKILDSQNSIDAIGSIDCIDSIDSIDSIDFIDSIDSLDPGEPIESIESVESILVPHKRPPTFTPHTKGKTTVPKGRATHQYCWWRECWRPFVWHEYRLYRLLQILQIL